MMVLSTALLLLAAATAVYFSGFTTVTLWAVDASLLVWCGTRWKKRWVWLAALALFAAAAVKALLTPGFLRLPASVSSAFFNPREIALLVLAAGCAVSARFFGKLEHADGPRSRRALDYGWIGTVFLLLSLGVSDYFLMLMGTSYGGQRSSFGLYRNVYLSAIWMLYSLPLLWFGLKRQYPPLFLSAITMISLAVGLGGIWSMKYTPIELFVPVLNARAALLIFLIVGILLHVQWLASVRRRYHRLEALMHFTWGLLLFELCTVETFDYFRRATDFAGDQNRSALVFGQFMTLGAVWMVYSLPTVRLGLARKLRPTLYLGLWALLLAICMAAVRGISYEPIEKYNFALNYRALILALVIAGSLVHATWIKYSGQLFGILYEILNSLRVAIALLVLVLLAGETRDYFEKQLFLLNSGAATAIAADSTRYLENIKHLSVSAVGLLYSLVLMGIGLWRRMRIVRLVAIGIFVVSVGKLLVYDISFLEGVFRIIASAGLICLLLATWYLVRRFKGTIMEEASPDEKKGSEHIII